MAKPCTLKHLKEHRLLEVCEHNQEHWSDGDYERYGQVRPVLTDEDLSKLGRWKRSANPRHVVVDEVRQWRVLQTRDDHGTVQVGTARYPEKNLGQAMSPRVMPTAREHLIKIDRDGEVEIVHTNRMRLSCTKWHNPVLMTKGRTRRVGGVAANPTALADLERRLGIKIG